MAEVHHFPLTHDYVTPTHLNLELGIRQQADRVGIAFEQVRPQQARVPHDLLEPVDLLLRIPVVRRRKVERVERRCGEQILQTSLSYHKLPGWGWGVGFEVSPTSDKLVAYGRYKREFSQKKIVRA